MSCAAPVWDCPRVLTSLEFRALADPTRRQILQDLREGEQSAGEIAARFTISAPSISRHLNRILYSLVADRLAVCVGNFLSTVCPEQIVLRQRRRRRPGAAGRDAKERPA